MEQEPDPQHMMNVEDVAALLKICSKTVRRLVDCGHMPPPVRLGRCQRWRRGTVERWLADREAGVNPRKSALAVRRKG